MRADWRVMPAEARVNIEKLKIISIRRAISSQQEPIVQIQLPILSLLTLLTSLKKNATVSLNQNQNEMHAI